MQELVAWAGRLCEQQLKVPQGRTAWTGERVPRDGHLARSWRSSPWFQQLPGSLLHGPAASVCSAERRRPSAARRSRTVDIVDIFLHRIDGNCSGMQEASCSAQAPSGCNRRPHGASGGPGGPRGATSVVRGSLCVSVLSVLFSLYRRVLRSSIDTETDTDTRRMEGRQHRAGLSSYALQEKVRLYNEAVLVISSISSRRV